MFREPNWSLPSHTCFYTDASGRIGFGGILKNSWFAGLWPPSWENIDIQTKEIYPIFLGLKIYGDQLQNKKLRIFSDNEAVVMILNKMTSKSKNVMIFVRLIVLEIMKKNILINVKHIAGFKNYTADKLSRNFLQEAVTRNTQLDPVGTLIPSELLPHNWI